jgi:hypothetical protein
LAQSKDIPYNREDLIPAVTQLVVDAYIEFGEFGADIDRNANCAKWTKTLRENGVIE